MLRHHPEKLGLTLDAHEWADTRALIEAINAIQPFDMEQLERIVQTDNTGKRPHLLLGGSEMGLKTGCGDGRDRWKHKSLLQEKKRIMQK